MHIVCSKCFLSAGAKSYTKINLSLSRKRSFNERYTQEIIRRYKQSNGCKFVPKRHFGGGLLLKGGKEGRKRWREGTEREGRNLPFSKVKVGRIKTGLCLCPAGLVGLALWWRSVLSSPTAGSIQEPTPTTSACQQRAQPPNNRRQTSATFQTGLNIRCT